MTGVQPGSTGPGAGGAGSTGPGAGGAQRPADRAGHGGQRPGGRVREAGWLRGWSLTRRVTALVVVVSAVLGLLGAVAAGAATVTRDEQQTLLEKIGPARIAAERLLVSLVNQETSVRGYALSGDRDALGPYTEGMDDERSNTAELRGLLHDRPENLRQIQTIEDRAAQWRSGIAEPVIKAVAAGLPGNVDQLGSDAARQAFDGVRAAVDALQDSLAVLRNSSTHRVTQSTNALVVLLVAAGLVILAAGVALAVLLRRLVTRPVAELAAEVRRVAQGDYSHHIDDGGPAEVGGLARDVEAMRQQIVQDLAEREAKAAELLRSNRDLEQFAYVASHDLQEPLRKVASFCQLLKRRYAGQLDERADQYINFAVDGAQRMQRLINDLLAFSRIGRVNSDFAEVDLGRVMGEVAGQLEGVRERAGAQLSWSELPVVRGAESLLATLLANLVSNSIKFRRPDVPCEIRMSARRVGGDWEISCEDNGIGIEAEYAEKVFMIFQRLHTKDVYPGTGIGLAISKKIIEYHGGRIWVDPESTEGTAIRFILPGLPDTGAAPDAQVTGPAATEDAGRSADAGHLVAPAASRALTGPPAPEPAEETAT